MKKDFAIEQGIFISHGGQLYDLHNCYDFKELKFEVSTRSVLLRFEPNVSVAGVSSKSKPVVLNFFGVDYFEISECFVSHVNHELSEIGYKNPGDRDHDWLISEDRCTSADHIFFRLANDEFIRLHSRWVNIEN